MTCPVPVASGIYTQVVDAMTSQQELANTTLSSFETRFEEYLNALTQVEIPALTYTFDWGDFDSSIGDQWQPIPALDPFSHEFVPPDAIINVDTSIGDPGTLAPYPGAPTKPAIDVTGLPLPWTGSIPTEIPNAPELTLPVLGTLPSIPALENIALPTLDPIEYPEFEGIRPVTSVALPDFPVPEEEDPYSSANLTAIQAQIATVLGGSRGYLDVVWDMIWERAYWNEANAAQAANEATMELWASKGWPVPGGVEAEQLLAQEQRVLSEGMKRAREIAIEQNKAEVERFNFHVAQGIALEGMLINLHSQSADRALKSVELGIRSAEALLNGKIAIINMQLSAYKTDAEVYVQRLQGEMAKVQVYAEQLKAAGLLLEVEKGKIEIVISTIDATIRAFLGQMEGVKVQLDVARLNVQVAVERINAAKASLEAKKLEYEGYDSKIRGQLGIANIWQTEGQIFLAQTQAISSQNADALKQYGFQIEKRKLLLERVQTDLKRFEVEYNAQVQQMDAAVKAYGAKVAYYEAQVKGETGRVTSNVERYRAGIEAAKLEETFKLQTAQSNLQTLTHLVDLQLAGTEKIMTATASIGSAALAALNINAGMSNQDQYSSNWSYQFECN